jgi:hypothetical protein
MIGHRRLATAALLCLAVVLLSAPFAAAARPGFTPSGGDRFSYDETIALGSGTGNYTGYTEYTVTNGSLGVTAVASNGTESADYYNANAWSNNQGQSESWTSGGAFTFSAETYHYVDGTDNQTGYTDPYVWFFMDNALPVGGSFFVLNTPMNVLSTSYDFGLQTAAGSYVRTIFAEGNGSYERNDVYGVFTASYNWKSYFDPATGYIVGYVYTEVDSDGAGDGFTITDRLGVTQTTYPLAAESAPAGGSGGGTNNSDLLVIGVVVVVVILVVLVIALAASRSRRRAPLPRHPAYGGVQYAPPPGGLPPPVNLTPGGQPAVQQIIVKETVKVNCRYCGALIDTTVDKCPFCGAART